MISKVSILNKKCKTSYSDGVFCMQKGAFMEELLTTIGELISTEINKVNDIEYVDKEMGYMFYIVLNDGKKVLVSLIESK